MRDESNREPPAGNVEGAPTLVYEVWDWVDSDKQWKPLDREACHWRFIGYRTLSLRQVLKYQQFGYLVERSPSRDRGSTSPLFPRVATTPGYQGPGLDPLPLPQP